MESALSKLLFDRVYSVPNFVLRKVLFIHLKTQDTGFNLILDPVIYIILCPCIQMSIHSTFPAHHLAVCPRAL